MKRVCLLLLGILPLLLTAQQKCVFFEKMVELEVEETSVNTGHSDFGPAFVLDELWYSAYTESEIKKLNRGVKKGVFYNLYSTKLGADGKIIGEKSLKMEALSEGYHESSVSYCEATGELFATLSNYDNPDIKNKIFQKANIGLKIIIAKKVNGVWEQVGELPYNSSKYSVGHPAISVTGDTLYFASDIPEKGYGGTDTYMAVRDNGEWGEMINLGDKINTAGNDMFPFMYKSKILIFASNGRKTGADLDLYHAGVFDGKVIEPSPIKRLNTEGDDFAFVIHPEKNFGYYTSDSRSDGVGHDDIYKVNLIEGKYDLELTVMEKESNQPVKNVKLLFNGKPMVAKSGVFKTELAFQTKYSVETDMEGYVNDSKEINTTGQAFGVIKEILWIQKPKVEAEFVMENIYYDFDKWDILPESEIELDKLVREMNRNSGWKVELGSHTDCRGSDKYNKVLSEKRSKSSVAYIVNNGISEDRIVAKGYGETKLVNKCDDGVSCTEEEHRKNRRTTFKILKIE